MTINEAIELTLLFEKKGIRAHANDEVGMMRAKKFYRSLGWVDGRDIYIYRGEIYLNVDWRPLDVQPAGAGR